MIASSHFPETLRLIREMEPIPPGPLYKKRRLETALEKLNGNRHLITRKNHT